MDKKVAIVTGASSGIGEACAWQFAKEGYHVVLAARNEAKIIQMSKELTTFGVNTLAVRTDVTKEEDCKHLVESTIKNLGRIDVLLNNAGISMRAQFQDVDMQVLRKLMDVNFWGTVNCTKYALPHILKTKGSIVGVSSIAGKQGLPGRIGYSASKFAMEGFLKTLRIEHMEDELHVLIACPGFTASNIRVSALLTDGEPQGESPLEEKKMMTAEEVAKHIVAAIQKRKRDIVLTLQGKAIVAFNKVLPEWVDGRVHKYMSREDQRGDFAKPNT